MIGNTIHTGIIGNNMKIFDFKDMFKGWFVGDFPTTAMPANFEVAYHTHTKGEPHQDHFHKEQREVTFIIEGEMICNGKHLKANDIFVIEPYEVSIVEFLTDIKVIVVKDICNTNDKYSFDIKT
jgi:uncharacterized protein YkuJ